MEKPPCAFGHIVPFLELAEQLVRRGHCVTFVSSAPRTMAKLSRRDRELSPLIRIVSLPLPAVDCLPDGAESTTDVPPEKVQLLKVAFDGLAGQVASFLTEACFSTAGEGHGRRPDWIFLDFAHHWLPPITDKHKITSSSVLAFRLHEAKQIARGFLPNASGISDMSRFWDTEQRCRLLVCRSTHEVDCPICALLRDLYAKPVIPSGLLAPYEAASAAGVGDEEEEETAGLMRWVDVQSERSVLYVAFGSEAPLTADALGLKLAGVRFVWVLRRKPIGEDDPPLPDRFEARVAGRGVVRVGWVPQVRVLAHAAVGRFMTHAGWSSLVESFLFGHPLVLLPLFGDQGLTARLMAERRVMVVGQESEVLARNAKEIQRVLWDRERREGYVDELIDNLLLQRHRE